MVKPRSRLLDLSVYILVRLITSVLLILTIEQARAFARLLGWIFYHLNKRHRNVALDNLKIAFGDEMTDAERDRTVRATYIHFCTVMVDMLHFPRNLHVHNWHHWMGEQRMDRLADLMLRDRPVLIVTGHFGNWEVAGYVMGVLGFQTYAIARTLDNPYLDAYLRSFRQSRGQTILSKNGDFERIQEALNANGKIATLGDQDAGARGLFVNFFGQPASTHKAIALMALQYNVPMVVVGVPRLNGRYKVIIQDVIEPGEYADQPDAVKAITQRFTTGLEELIRLAPEQYFWLHRRWKHQPQGRAKKQANREVFRSYSTEGRDLSSQQAASTNEELVRSEDTYRQVAH